RLMIMTFHGENRTGEAARQHLREVPPVMWVPLAVLAVLSVVGGWVNVPEVIRDLPVIGWIPASEWLHEWLHPVTAAADGILAANLPALSETAPLGGGAAAWAIGSFVLAVAVILFASKWVGARDHRPATESPELTGFARVLNQKWYVDQVYDALVVRPSVSASHALWRVVDHGIIDGVVNGLGHATRVVGWAGCKLQTGQLNTYAFAVAIGVLIFLGFVAF